MRKLAVTKHVRSLLWATAAVAALAVLLIGGRFAYRYWDARRLTTIRVDPETQHQSIDGWAVYPRYWEDDKRNDRFDRLVDQYADAVSIALAEQVGINAVRIEIWSGLENPTDYWTPHYEGKLGYKAYAPHRYEKVNDNADANVVNPAGFQFAKFDHRVERMILPLLRAIERAGSRPYINVCYVDFKWNEKDQQGTLSHAQNPAEFAEFVAVFFARLRDKYGITPDAFEVILEPENTQDWRGKQIGEGLLAVQKRLSHEGFAPKFIAPSNTSMHNALSYFDELVQVPGAAALLDTFAYHRYHVPLRSEVEQIATRAAQYHLKTAMLEKVGAGIDVLLEDLTVGNVSSWQQWAAATKKGGKDEPGYYLTADLTAAAADGEPQVELAALTRQLAPVFRAVKRGAVRLGAESSTRDKQTVAFRNPQGALVVVVRGQRAGGDVTVHGLPDGSYRTQFAGDDLRASAGQAVARDGTLSARLPGRGVLVLESAR